jgi:hypothetical protein
LRVLTSQASHTYGVIDPQLVERRDTKFLAASLSSSRNVIMLPQGGYMDRGGTDRIGLFRRKLVPVAIQSFTGNGGSTAGLTDSSSSTFYTSGDVTGADFVALTINLAANSEVAAVDLTDFSCETGSRDDCVHIEYRNTSNQWVDLQINNNHIRTTRRTRRFAVLPGSKNVVCNAVRITVRGGSGIGSFLVRSIAVWRESADIATTVLRSFNYQKSVNYQLALYERGVDIYRDGAWCAALPAPWTDGMVRAIKPEFDYDTALMFHQSMLTARYVRQGSDTEWNYDRVPYTNLPLVDFGGTYTNGVNEQQRLTFTSFAAGDRFQLILNGYKTDEITIPAGGVAAAGPAVKAALEELPGVDPGLTVTASGTTQLIVTFTGGANAARDWPEMEPILFANSKFISIGTKERGKVGGEPIISSLRGYPAVGRITQERLVAAGSVERAGTVIASVTGEPFNFDIELQGAAASLSYDIGGNQSAVRDIHVAGTLILFTDDRVWHLATGELSAEKKPTLLKSDAPGIEPHLSPLSLSNAIYYVQRGGQTIVQLNYSELERNFIGDNASVLSAFLVSKPKDWTLRRSTDSNDSDVMMYINENGTLVTVTIMRAQEVSGFAPHQTQAGIFESLCVDGNETVYFVTKRTMRDGERLVFEKMQPDKQLDCSREWTFTHPHSRLDGLGDYAGQDLHVYGDGEHLGVFTVDDDHIMLPVAVQKARAGFWLAPRAIDTPFHPDEEARRPLSRMRRVFGVEVSLLNTEAIAIGVNGAPLYAVPIDGKFTGLLETEGYPGFTRTAQCTITQTRPGRLNVRMVKKKIAA